MRTIVHGTLEKGGRRVASGRGALGVARRDGVIPLGIVPRFHFSELTPREKTQPPTGVSRAKPKSATSIASKYRVHL